MEHSSDTSQNFFFSFFFLMDGGGGGGQKVGGKKQYPTLKINPIYMMTMETDRSSKQ